MKTYTTISGDTWDLIAYKVYGNEKYCDRLMDTNRDYLETMVFKSGIVLSIPDESTFRSSTVTSDTPNGRFSING